MNVGDDLNPDDPNNHCFGCSHHNPHGLQLKVTYAGGQCAEAKYEVPAHMCGALNVVHGGIQATLLDEAGGFACRTLFLDDLDLRIVTAEFSLRYRKPVLTGTPLTIRGEVVRSEGRNIFVEASILDSEDKVLTTSEARWVRLEAS